ncbi:MAG: hypothetical protein AB1349_02850 [Elusimicrobiota bacterium]
MKYYGLLLAVFAGMLAGCATTQEAIKPAPSVDEKMIWSSHPQRPGWTVSEPAMEDDKLTFVGLSAERVATEKDARDEAHNNAINYVVKYIGTFVDSKIEKIATTYGLSADIVNPTEAKRSRSEQLSTALTTRVKSAEWYLEKYRNKMEEVYYKAFVKASVPKTAIDEAYKDIMDSNIDDMKKKRDAASDEKAKSQFQNAMNAFEDAKNKGFTLEK